MFEKIVVVDSTGLNTWGVERLKELGKEVVFYTGIPETDEEIVNRIGDADCVLSNTSGCAVPSIASLARMWI